MSYSHTSLGPSLPEPVLVNGMPADNGPQPSPARSASSMRHGCYFAQWIPSEPASETIHYNGVMRVERRDDRLTASADFYRHLAYKEENGSVVANPDPSPRDGIPIFPRKDYLYYLRVTQLQEQSTTENAVDLAFERHSFNHDDNTWTTDGNFSAQVTIKTTPEDYPSGSVYFEGKIKDSFNAVVGDLKLGWLSKHFRKATLEVDRVAPSEYPADSGTGVDWKTIYDSVDWDVNVYESHSDIVEPSGISWSNAELHAKMIERRNSSDLENEWRYYLLCVRRTSKELRGIMFDTPDYDYNKTAREGAAIATHWVIPDIDRWGTIKGQRFGASGAPYFRTAVHEIGHTMGLLHNDADNGLMNTTGTIADSPGTFPANIKWSFNAADECRLRHLPDPWVRPGMIPYGQLYDTVPISSSDRVDLSDSLGFEVKPLLPTVPIGAPVRARVTLRNKTSTPIDVPPSLSLMSGYVSGRVVGPGGVSRRFQSVMRCVDEHEHKTLQPGTEINHDLTLLRGSGGALFEAPGLHQIKVDVMWKPNKVPFCVRGGAAVMVQPATNENHAKAALKTLSTPDLLLTLALGGDHLPDGLDALEAALADEILAPHYAVIEAKRLCRRFRERDADRTKALKLLKSETVMSPSEVRSVVSLTEGVKYPRAAVKALKRGAAGDRAVEDMVKKL